MKTTLCLYLIGMVFLAACACGPAPDIRPIYAIDCRSPEILQISPETSRSLKMVLSEKAEVRPSMIHITPPLEVDSIQTVDDRLLINFSEDQVPGTPYLLEGKLEDLKGNTLHFMDTFYGKNDRVPALCINEFTVKGSGSHPDSVEISVLSEGDTAGITLMDGPVSGWSLRYILPSLCVKKGDYIVVHFKPQGIPGETDETTDRKKSTGYDASESAYDFWVKGGTGLSSNNGILMLYESPGGGKVLDAVIYSNRTSDSDDRYGGFGSASMQAAAEELDASDAWEKTGDRIVPEDAVNPELSTGTRSICRDEFSSDTNSKKDWKVVQTRGITFGRPNTSKSYEEK